MVSTEDLMAEILALKEQVQRMADAMLLKEDRKKYQAEYYRKKKAANAKKKKERSRLPNPDRSLFEGRRNDRKMPHKRWADKLREFHEDGRSIWNWLTWLAWAWNQDTWEMSPITRSGGYYHVFIGLDGNGKAIRSKYTERDVTGHVRVNSFTSTPQLSAFADALWWKYAFRSVGYVTDYDYEDWYKQLPKGWDKTLRLIQGNMGHVELQSGLVFDQHEADLHRASKMYGLARMTLEQAWACSLKGFFATEEPFKKAM